MKGEGQVEWDISKVKWSICLLLVLHISLGYSFFLYWEGFFTTTAQCDDTSPLSDADTTDFLNNPPFKKLVWVIIDALRYDFLLGERSKMIHTHQLLSQGKGYAYKAHAHAPTVTFPRIKAMVSGSIPAFTDFITNFMANEHSEDSIIKKLYEQGKDMVFYGDDTWLKLFPDLFVRSEGTTSFFVSDYTEVDDNVTRNLDIELDKDWDVMILHYLGLDHIGHSYGPDSPLMNNKMTEMDGIIQKIYDRIEHDESTLLVVCGDHGMNQVGNHGGSTVEESTTGMVFLSPSFHSSEYVVRDINQIDIVPTLSNLLGISIPLKNLGVIIPELFQSIINEEYYMNSLNYNAHQLNVLLERYGKHELPSYIPLVESFQQTNTLLKQYRAGDIHLKREIINHYNNFTKHLYDKLSVDIFGYNEEQLYMSIILFGILCLTVTYLLYFLSYETYSYVTFSLEIMAGYFIGSIIGGLCIYVTYAILMDMDFSMLFLGFPFSIIFGICISLLTVVAVFWKIFHGYINTPSVDGYFCYMGIIAHVISLGSSSFIEEEHQIIYFLSQTWLVILFLKALVQMNSKQYSFALIAIVTSRIIQSWNQTGDKYLGADDISKYLIKEENYYLLVTLSCVTLVGIVSFHTISSYLYDSNDKIFKTFKSLFNFVLYYTFALICMRNSNVNNIISLKMVEYLALWGILVLLFITVLNFKLSNEETSHTRYNLNSILVIFGLFSLLLHRFNNYFLFSLFSLQIFSLYQYFSIGSRKISWSMMIGFFWLGNSAYFSLLNSNSLSTIDISNAYVGMDSYHPVLVPAFTYIILYTGPILYFLAFIVLIVHFTPSRFIADQNITSFLFVTFTIRSCFSFACSLVLFIERYHLFVWSVFSPRFCYEILHESFEIVKVLIAVIVMSLK
eukprot:TRINITY_DN671_c0_g2_i2.p1 TRINITY_DN671_c0_g2~~TRINITY_DN671_c0_g2_i2.p1  ORF type:complete len:901 (-),score=93.06 TRINITY_DN671_c0_g2_i2:93-2795(-)